MKTSNREKHNKKRKLYKKKQIAQRKSNIFVVVQFFGEKIKMMLSMLSFLYDPTLEVDF